ncbi:hypothetical protein BDF22DRAFT_379142 [Syncephalis plumigaleata]|nr:hypothetical protein BDF22DRAFT_379142 [Syncephalis plumigaleata]
MIFPSAVAPLIRHRNDYVVLHDNTTALASFERKSYSEVQLALKHFELVPTSTLNRTDSENHTSNILFMLVQSYPSVTNEHANNSNIRNVQDKCKDIRNNRGNRPDNWITLDDMNKRTLHDDDVNNHPMHIWRVSHNQMSQVLVLNCANANVKLTYDVNALDIDYFGIPTYLPTQLRHLPLILTIMSAGVWPCILVVWLIYSYKYRQFYLPLHKLITFIPLLRFACSALVTVGMYHLAYHGRIEKFPKISIQVLLAISCFFESASIMLISKGWCITRARLTFMEKRTIWGGCPGLTRLYKWRRIHVCLFIQERPSSQVVPTFANMSMMELTLVYT